MDGDTGVLYGDVELDVDFGTAEWSGTLVADELLDIDASGVVQANTIVSDSITGSGVDLGDLQSGIVEGVFVGSEAPSIIGVVDAMFDNGPAGGVFGATQ